MSNTTDQKLDGSSICPGHAHHVAGQHYQYHCEDCEFPRGYNAAAAIYKHHTSSYIDIPYWEQQWKRNMEQIGIGGITHYYWCGYLSYVMERKQGAYESAAQRESVLKGREKQDRELGPREFTLTYSPSWFETDEEAQRAMTLAIERLTKYYKKEIIEFNAVGEYTAAGASHIHAWYHLTGGRKITDKSFKRAYPRWNPKKKLGRGFEGGHHQTINRLSDFSSYIEKHLDEAWFNLSINNGNEEEDTRSSPSTGSQESTGSSSQHNT